MKGKLTRPVLLAAFFVSMVCPAFAELPPSVYEARQKAAPESLKIEILRVEIEPGDQSDQQKVEAVAMVTSVERTATELKPDQIINISYVITDRARDYNGPGEIPLLIEGETSVAYLAKDENGPGYLPVAGVMSFQNF
ncbi:MAG: hypothetical protein WEB60_05775 [Terrimicrobiaceae bacterium]